MTGKKKKFVLIAEEIIHSTFLSCPGLQYYNVHNRVYNHNFVFSDINYKSL